MKCFSRPYPISSFTRNNYSSNHHLSELLIKNLNFRKIFILFSVFIMLYLYYSRDVRSQGIETLSNSKPIENSFVSIKHFDSYYDVDALRYDNRTNQLLPLSSEYPRTKGVVNSISNQPYYAQTILEKSSNLLHQKDNDKKTEEKVNRESTSKGLTLIMSEGFEGSFPNSLWSANSSSGYTDAYWDDATCKDYNGSYSAHCADMGSQSVSCGYDYPNDMKAYMVYGPFDLSNATDAYLNFHWWAHTESDYDYFQVMASKNGTNYYGVQWSGNNTNWYQYTFDLTDVYTIGNLCGQQEVWIAFFFQSDYTVSEPEGAYVDNVELWKYSSTQYEPDLTIASGSFSPNPVNIDDYLSIDVQIKNIGLGAATSSRIEYYLLIDPSSGVYDCYLGYDYVTLEPGEAGNETITIDLENISCISGGYYYISVYFVDENEGEYHITPLEIMTTGIYDNTSLDHLIKIYPNPVEDILTIENQHEELSDNMNIMICDLTGKQILSKPFHKKITNLDLSKLLTGVYFLKISNDNDFITEKIIKK